MSWAATKRHERRERRRDREANDSLVLALALANEEGFYIEIEDSTQRSRVYNGNVAVLPTTPIKNEVVVVRNKTSCAIQCVHGHDHLTFGWVGAGSVASFGWDGQRWLRGA